MRPLCRPALLTVIGISLAITACGGNGEPGAVGGDGSAGPERGAAAGATHPSEGPGLIRSHPPSPAAAAGTPDAHAGAAGHYTWTLPEGWVEETPSSRMRLAQFRIPGKGADAGDGECAVFYFGAGQGGSIQGNVERWAGQFESPGGGPAQPDVKVLKAGDLSVTRVELRGTYKPSAMTMTATESPSSRPGSMLLGAIVPGADANWFIRCSGPEATLTANRNRFDALIASLRPGHPR